MDVLTSTEFRKRYASLRKPTAVTVNGHSIGIWHPNAMDAEAHVLLDVTNATGPVTAPGATLIVVGGPRGSGGGGSQRPMTQTERDAILRKVNRRE